MDQVTLQNKQGSSEGKWKTPTLFVIGGVGIVYGDKNLLNDSTYFNNSEDAYKIKAKGIKKLKSLEEGKYFMKIDIPLKQSRVIVNQQEKLSTLIAEEVWNRSTDFIEKKANAHIKINRHIN